MANIVNVRLIVPRENANVDDDFVGHYDMQIEGTINFNNRSFNNPVFSYRTADDGCLDVFDGDMSSDIYGANNPNNNTYRYCDIYKWSTVVSESDLNYFIAKLTSVIESDSVEDHPSGNGLRCKMKDGTHFQKYIFTYYNCFHAVSVWMKWLGEVRFYNIHKAIHDEAADQYSAARMMNEYSDNDNWVDM